MLLFTASLQARGNTLAGKTTSASGQFVIYSKDATRRTNLAQRADEARAQWLQKIGSDGAYGHTIIIQDLIGGVKPRGKANAVTGVFEGDGGVMKVRTDIYDASVLRGPVLETEIYRALA
ncbi:MAG: hypothetical protein ACOYM3_31855, partial [Terrimicrobiaceae bacterium]